ncbi:MAG: fimbrillin family protein [Bacteroidaceae bacterium]|nr:fimbrillin family protein [Bacteroidaceae bacterium]
MPALMLALAGMMPLASCSDDAFEKAAGNVTKDDGRSILVEVDSETPDADTRTQYNLAAWHTEFASGDEIGVFAYNGTDPVASNIKFTYDGTRWNGEVTIPYNENYTYFAYYPYAGERNNPPYTVGTSGTVDSRFSSFISDSNNKFHYADQSTAANFAKSDYMHAQGTDAGLRTITFTMQHKKALAVIGQTVNKWYDTTDPMTPHDTYVTFSDNIPYTSGDNRYFLCKNNVVTTVGGTSFTGQGGKYVIKDASVLTGTPSFTYSVSTDGGNTWGYFSSNRPSWLTVTGDVASGEPTDFNVTMTNSKTTELSLGPVTFRNVPNDDILKAASAVSNVDLSMMKNDGTSRGSRTTANCYLVHAPGTYRLPLVYGNAIRNGDESSSSSFYTTQTSNTLQRLVNHLDQGITAPWIKDNGITVDGGRLIWEDVKGMIKNVAVSGDYLTFEVNADKIAEGNAVIAATASGTTVWSWHIWVTAETLTYTTSVPVDGRANPYIVTPVNVGQINGTCETGTIYAGSQCKVRATGTGGTVEFLVVQPDYLHSNTYYNPSPYYQWGRKDPMFSPIGAYDAGGNALTYSTSDATSYVSSTDTTIGSTIQNPRIWYYNSSSTGPYGNGTNAKKYNYWDMNNTSADDNDLTPTVKTVYDPCPPGLCIPTGGLYVYIKRNYSSYFPWDTNRRTWTKNIPNITFPAAGYRDYINGSLKYAGDYGNYWSVSPVNSTNGRALGFTSSNASWVYDYHSSGYPVRAVLEE